MSPRSSRDKDVEEACKKEVVDVVPKSEERNILQYIMNHWSDDGEFGRQVNNISFWNMMKMTNHHLHHIWLIGDNDCGDGGNDDDCDGWNDDDHVIGDNDDKN